MVVRKRKATDYLPVVAVALAVFAGAVALYVANRSASQKPAQASPLSVQPDDQAKGNAKSGSVAVVSATVQVGAMTDHCIAKVQVMNKTPKAVASLGLSIDFKLPGRAVAQVTAHKANIQIPSGIEPGETIELTENIPLRQPDGQLITEDSRYEAYVSVVGESFGMSQAFIGQIQR